MCNIDVVVLLKKKKKSTSKYHMISIQLEQNFERGNTFQFNL